MSRVKEIFFPKNIGAGYLYFYVHFIVEIVCFFFLTKQLGDSAFGWLYPLIYDGLAFVPQSLIGYWSDKNAKIPTGIIGIILLFIAILSFWFNFLPGKFTSLIILCLGNAFLHVNGAEVTLRCSEGKLSHSAIFVAGGSFGVIVGKLLGKTSIPYWLIIILILTMIPFVLLAEDYRKEADKQKQPCKKFDYHSLKISAGVVILLSVMIVIVRGYMGYGIPTAWNKTIFQTIMLYVVMGIGKGLGGILADAFGVKKIAVFSALFALPFLLFGDNYMLISLIGVMFFSMTMSITLALLVSVLKNTPGLAFGLTTIGLFLGTAPIFFFKFTTTSSNCIVILLLTLICLIAVSFIIRKDKKYE